MNFLIVDDEPLVLEAVVSVVKKVVPTAKLFSFSNATEALEFSETTKIDIALLDIDMRVVNGISMAKSLINRYPKINIIFCTGYAEYSLEALNVYCSGYILKPINVRSLKDALEHLRYPIEKEKECACEIVCFGNFEVYCNKKPVKFKYRKSKEMLAYLVDRKGTTCTTREIFACIFEDAVSESYFNRVRQNLLQTFDELGIGDVLIRSFGTLALDKDKVKCDYFDYLDGREDKFMGEYMSQYSFGEETLGMLLNHK